MKRKKQKKIQWFLDFISIDIERLSEADRVEIAIEIQKYIYYHQGGGALENAFIRKDVMKFLPGLTAPERLIAFQKRIADFFGFMTVRLEYTKNMPSKGWTLTEETDFHPSLGRDSVEMDFELRVDGFHYDIKTEDNDGKKYKLKPESLKDAFINISYNSPLEAHRNLFLYCFINLIDGVPINAFKKCPECEKWVANLTKKEKIYCSNRCAAKRRQREQRLELYDKIADGDSEAEKRREIELMKGRARARQSYEKKVKKEQPNAKISKNPRKPHWNEEEALK